MDKNIKEWLDKNPPKVNLTQFEKSIKIEDLDPKKHILYMEEINGFSIYRLRKMRCTEYIMLYGPSKQANRDIISNFKKLWDSLEFCPLGYNFDDLIQLSNHYGKIDYMICFK